jgi:translation initiation factor 5A
MQLDSDFEADDLDQAKSVEASFVPVNEVKVGGTLMIEDTVCQIEEKKDIKIGKHGHAKHIIRGREILNNDHKVHVVTINSGHDVMVPIVRRREYQVVQFNDGHATVLTTSATLREDIEIPYSMQSQILANMDAGKDVIISCLSHDDTIFVTGFRSKMT